MNQAVEVVWSLFLRRNVAPGFEHAGGEALLHCLAEEHVFVLDK